MDRTRPPRSYNGAVHHHYLVLALMMTGFGLCLAQTSTDTQLASISTKLDSIDQTTNGINKILVNCDCCPKPRDCADIRAITSVSGVYTIYIGYMQRAVSVYCDMTTDNGGWTVIQRRKDGSLDFYKPWTSYVAGFGSPSAEFWLGLQNIRDLTYLNSNQYILRVDLGDFSGNVRYATYDNFKLGPASGNYVLTSLGTYVGNAGDSLTIHAGAPFSTFDQDHDTYVGNCAVQYHGAWWYKACHASNLNGYYYPSAAAAYGYGVEWKDWLGYYVSLKFTEIKIKRIDAIF